MSLKVAVPLSAATTRYGSSPSWRTTCGGGTTTPPTMLSVMSSIPRMNVRVALPDLGLERGPVGRRLLHHEAALGADGHDHRVLHHLGLHEAEHLGAEVLHAVRPAQAAAGDAPAAQVHALDARRVHPDLEHRPRQRQVGDLGRVELEAEPRPMAPVGTEPVGVGPQRRLDEVQERRAGCGPRRGSPPRRGRGGARRPGRAPPRPSDRPARGRSAARTAPSACGRWPGGRPACSRCSAG